MKAFKRWIVLAPAAIVLLAGLPGCKTGAKWFSHHQTGCATSEAACGDASSTACADSSPSGCVESPKTACADSSKTVCGNGQTACADANSKCCLGKKVSCAAMSGCVCGADGKGCLCGKGQTACATTACATSTGCVAKSSSKTSCASTGCVTMGCVTMGKPECGPPQGVVITPKAVVSQPKPVYETPVAGRPNPFEAEAVIVPQQAARANPGQAVNQEPLPQEDIQEFPIPAPPADDETSHVSGNPFLPVSQTEEIQEREAVSAGHPFAAGEEPRPVGRQLSKPWADAMGLPGNASAPAEPYRWNQAAPF